MKKTLRLTCIKRGLGLAVVGTLLATAVAARGQAQTKIEIPSGSADRDSTHLYLPERYGAEPARKWPLVLVLHGYSVTGATQNFYFGLSQRVSGKAGGHEGFILAVPESRVDSSGKPFWNATEFCCDFEHSGVDDVGYLLGLVARLQRDYAVDPNRVYVIGHSNGGFMANRLLCEASPVFAGIAALAGTNHKDLSKCAPKSPVSVLQIHAQNDPTIAYAGNDKYPGALETAEFWARQGGCETSPRAGERLNLTRSISGLDATPLKWDGCREGAEVALWTIDAKSFPFYNPHIPYLSPEFMDHVLGFLFSKSRR